MTTSNSTIRCFRAPILEVAPARAMGSAFQCLLFCSCMLSALPGFAQLQSISGGLRMVISDPQSLYARKGAQSGTSNSGATETMGGGSSSAETELVLTNGTISAQGVSGNTRTELSHTGFTTESGMILGPSTLETSAFALADPTIEPAADPKTIIYSSYTSLFLVREASSLNPSFVNSFSRSLR